LKIFTIENETNNITVHATIQDAEAVANADCFRNEAGLNKLAADWPAARLIEIWNSLPGVTLLMSRTKKAIRAGRQRRHDQRSEGTRGRRLAPQTRAPRARPESWVVPALLQALGPRHGRRVPSGVREFELIHAVSCVYLS
jgi:hypothetical protein